VSAATALRGVRLDRRVLLRLLEPAALVLLLAVLPLESVLVIATQVVIPPYIVALPLLALVALASARSLRELVPPRVLTISLLAWISVTALSLVMWVVQRPPNIHLAAGYGTVRASALRGPLQLAITLAFLAALPLVLALARRRLGLAVGCFVGAAALVALYGIYQVVANRIGLPFENISNDPLVVGRAIPGWRGLLRPYSTFGEPSPLAAYLLGPMTIALTLAVWSPSRRARMAAAIAAAVMFSTFVLTLSTGAWLALPVDFAIVVAVLVQRRAWRSLAVIPFAAVAVVVVTLAPLLSLTPQATTSVGVSAPSQSRPHATSSTKPQRSSLVGSITRVPGTIVRRIRDSIDSGRAGPRLEIQRYQLHLWEAHPVLGVGIGAADLYTAHKLHQSSLPSTYGVWFGVLSETGTAGFVALLLVVGVFAATCARTLRARPNSPWFPVITGALAGVIGELVAYFWFYERIPAHLWALMGLGVLATWRAQLEAPA